MPWTEEARKRSLEVRHSPAHRVRLSNPADQAQADHVQAQGLKEAVMPENTRVARCVKKLKGRKGVDNPYAVCQKSTGQSYKTGKKLRSKPKAKSK